MYVKAKKTFRLIHYATQYYYYQSFHFSNYLTWHFNWTVSRSGRQILSKSQEFFFLDRHGFSSRPIVRIISYMTDWRLLPPILLSCLTLRLLARWVWSIAGEFGDFKKYSFSLMVWSEENFSLKLRRALFFFRQLKKIFYRKKCNEQQQYKHKKEQKGWDCSSRCMFTFT